MGHIFLNKNCLNIFIEKNGATPFPQLAVLSTDTKLFQCGAEWSGQVECELAEHSDNDLD